jgi:hypothetical protein
VNPKKPQEVYQITAERLNLPPEYVRDVVEHFYSFNKSRMHTISYIIFTITGLGRFVIRPKKFWKRKERLEKLISDFRARRDNRGLMINREIDKRYQEMMAIEPEVQKLIDYKNARSKSSNTKS